MIYRENIQLILNKYSELNCNLRDALYRDLFSDIYTLSWCKLIINSQSMDVAIEVKIERVPRLIERVPRLNITRFYNSIENQRKNFELSGSTPLLDLLNLSIIRVFGGVSAILSHQIKNIREYNEEELRN